MHTLEENNTSKIRNEVHIVMTTIKTIVQDAVLTAIENLVNPTVELAMKLTNASSGRIVDGKVLDADERAFSGKVEGLQMTASSAIHSPTDLNKDR